MARRLPLTFALALARHRGRGRVGVRRAELQVLLARRDEILADDERAAVRAALESATPAERALLEQLLRPSPTLPFTS